MRRLEADLTTSRRLCDERGAEIGRLRGSLDAAVALAAERLEMVNRLEDDLAASCSSKSSKVLRSSEGGISGVGGGGLTPVAEVGDVPGSSSTSHEALRELLGVSEAGGRRGGGSEADHGVLGIVQVRGCAFGT